MAWGDLAEKLRQHGGVADVAFGDFDSADFQRLLIDPEVDLAPDAAFGAAVLAGVPLALAFDLDPGAVDQQMQRPVDFHPELSRLSSEWKLTPSPSGPNSSEISSAAG